ncbi:hypothetical protein BOTBODRAFT_147561 [Botryobasidium botryosum FD-172 SS1]|uniref:F-box domain-containing protein n=1 Tax=Botryobasidium botryosum (strain FD-172 SS1) TaxID=930990 RepID=A0A067M5N3_BOTB1|nr:hypothetical protein BOTBODRAFT_147561 [Botryobasidium botryosum FD-172 SS1]
MDGAGFEPLNQMLQALHSHIRRNAPRYLQPRLNEDDPLEGLDQEHAIAVLAGHTMAAAVDRYMQKKARAIKSFRNGLSPIYRLPSELLALIFELLVHALDNSHQPLRDMPLEIGIVPAGSPELGQLNSPTEPMMLAHARWIHNANIASLCTMLCPHLHRWESFSIRGLDIERLQQLLPSRAPALRRLHMDGGVIDNSELVDDYRSIPHALFNGYTPNLRSVDIIAVGLNLHSPIFRNLTRLRLELIDYVTSTIQDFFDSLAACPRLTFLSLNQISFSQPQRPLTRPLELFDLKELGFYCIYPETINSILRSIQVPPLLDFSIEVSKGASLEMLLPPLPILLRNLPYFLEITHINAASLLHGVAIDGYGTLPDCKIYINLGVCDDAHDPPQRSLFRSLGVDLPLSNLESLAFDNLRETCCFLAEDFAATLQNLPTITALTLDRCSPCFEDVLIATPRSRLCPLLEFLELQRSEITDERLAAIIESRVHSEGPRSDEEGRVYLRALALACCPGVSRELLETYKARIHVALDGKRLLTTEDDSDSQADEEVDGQNLNG